MAEGSAKAGSFPNARSCSIAGSCHAIKGIRVRTFSGADTWACLD